MAEYPHSKGSPKPVAHRGRCAPWLRLERDPKPYGHCIELMGRRPVRGPKDIYRMLAPVLLTEEQEVTVAVYLDAKGRVRGISEIARGGRSSVTFDLHDVIRIGVIEGASGCVVCHNHPSGDPRPSIEDAKFTLSLRDKAKEFFGQDWLLDHVIVGYGELYSFSDNDWRASGNPEKVDVPEGVKPPPEGGASERARAECNDASCQCAHHHAAAETVTAAYEPQPATVRHGVYYYVSWSDAEAMRKKLAPIHPRAEVVDKGELYVVRLYKGGPHYGGDLDTFEAKDAGAYATNKRDPKEVEAGRALGSIETAADVYALCAPLLAKESQEVFLVLPLDLRGQLLSRPVEIARGQRDRVAIDPSDVFRPVVLHNAKGFVVVHCHPSGHAKPSDADKSLTQKLDKSTPMALGGEVHFVDHVVIATTGRRGEFYSFRAGKIEKAPLDKRARAA